MPVAADQLAGHAGRRGGARAGRRAQPVPVCHTFIEDCETPVSAFLKLRGAGPAFLLESAEQGQRVGRWSFIGYKPRRVVRWSLADGGDPTSSPSARSRATARRRSTACRRSRAARSASSATTACARSSASPEPNPDPIGLPDMALMLSDVILAFDHLRHTVTILANAYAEEDGGVEAAHARAVESIREVRERLAGPLPRPADRHAPRARSRSSSPTCRARRSRRWSRGSSSTCTPATPSRSCPRSAGRRRRRSSRSRSTAGCAPSTRRRTCTSWTSRTSRSSAPRPSRS